jgi:hypothetical protein
LGKSPLRALFSNTSGTNNTATGYQALFSNTGFSNTANGYLALNKNTTGSGNTANGASALFSSTTGFGNFALGVSAGFSLTTGDLNIDIGNLGLPGEANTIRIGASGSQARAFIAGIRDVTTGNANAITVVIDSAGQLGTMSSSRRFKKEIKPMDSASEAILGLKPVTFHYKSDNTGTPQFGLIAEEVAEVYPDLVGRNPEGQPGSVRYEQVNAMLLNEFLKEHRKVEKLEAAIAQQRKDFEATTAQQQKRMEAVTARLEEQATQIQKVSAQLEVKKPAPKVVRNNQ